MKRLMPGMARPASASRVPRPSASLVIIGVFGTAFALAACDDARLDRAGPERARTIDVEHGFSGERRTAASPGSAGGGLAGVRARADAAFATRTRPPTRRTSRIGVQPWPSDLPARWPRPARATVLADTRRPGERLLLVDLPASADDAARRFGEALRAGGYGVEEGDPLRNHRVLHATGRDHEVVLIFTPRERATRIEILFLDSTPG